MSGTSLDGIDAAIVWTDGIAQVRVGDWISRPYDEAFRHRLRALLGAQPAGGEAREIELELTDRHIEVVNLLIEKSDISYSDIDIIGFHGHTITHRPADGLSWQIGDGGRLAAALGCDVVADFRSADVAAGGQGAPLAPLYHQALSGSLPKPLAVLNLGGVGNVTWVGSDDIIAFDTGPGNGLIDDWVRKHGRGDFDVDGAIAAAGRLDEKVLSDLLADSYFRKPPPKSLDRLDFNLRNLERLSMEDGAATLTAFTTRSVVAARAHLPSRPLRWLVTGGGRHNRHLMDLLERALDVPVDPVESVGWEGDALEAQAFAYLAVRSILKLPLSLPSTTGVPKPISGGTVFRAQPS